MKRISPKFSFEIISFLSKLSMKKFGRVNLSAVLSYIVLKYYNENKQKL